MHQKTYGLDVSFPHHHTKVSTNYDWLPHNDPAKSSPSHPNYVALPSEYKHMPVQRLGNRQDFYDNYMEGCRHHEKSDHEACDQSEADRIHMNVIQPQSMVNYTTLGFTKVKTPAKVFKQIKKFWEDNKGTEEPEEWFTGNTYTNHVSVYNINVLSLSLSFSSHITRVFFFSNATFSYIISRSSNYCNITTTNIIQIVGKSNVYAKRRR